MRFLRTKNGIQKMDKCSRPCSIKEPIVNAKTAKDCIAAGADVLVAGSAVFGAADPAAAVGALASL